MKNLTYLIWGASLCIVAALFGIFEQTISTSLSQPLQWVIAGICMLGVIGLFYFAPTNPKWTRWQSALRCLIGLAIGCGILYLLRPGVDLTFTFTLFSITIVYVWWLRRIQLKYRKADK